MATAAGPRVQDGNRHRLTLRPRLRGECRPGAARAGRRPLQPVEAHLPHPHPLIPGVVDDVIGLAVGPDDYRVVPGPADPARNPLQDAGLTALARVGPRHGVGDGEVNAVVLRLVVRAAVEAVVAPPVLADRRALDRV